MHIEARLADRGLILPLPAVPPPGFAVPFAWARPYADRVYLSGHGPLSPHGSLAPPLGKVGAELSLEEACEAARLATLSLLASLKRAIGDLDRVAAWLVLWGHVNAAPGFTMTTHVMHSASDLILDLYGSEIGAHARTAIGVAELPADLPVVIAAEVALRAA